MKVAIRIMLSIVSLMIVMWIIDSFVEKGLVKYILIGLSVTLMTLFNEKQNRKLKETKDNDH
ncbi:hypothetical protein IM538_14055 [Cytobacillus suaedae]|nr:hypothetical protein IM538_14055 [Cytobacillus suaedae]